jgi:hypothetical protein
VPPDSIIKLVMKHGYARSNEGVPVPRVRKNEAKVDFIQLTADGKTACVDVRTPGLCAHMSPP